MRPIVHPPGDPNPYGADQDWHEYGKAQPYLIQGLGGYCSYCERKIVCSIAVEHVIPKSLCEGLALQWSNFLLACTNCNSAKSDLYRVQLWYHGARWAERVPGTFCLFPHRLGATAHMLVPDDNAPNSLPANRTTVQLRRTAAHASDSFNSFQYLPSGEVTIHPDVPGGLAHDRAALTLALVRLDRLPTQGEQEVQGAYKVKYQGIATPSRGLVEFKRSANAATISVSAFDPNADADALALLQSVGNLANAYVVAAVVAGLETANTLTRIEVSANNSGDYRVVDRRETYALAERYRSKFDRMLGPYFRRAGTAKLGGDATPQQYALTPEAFQKKLSTLTKLTIVTAQGTGFWSVWVTVFKASAVVDPRFQRARPAIVPVLRELLNPANFPGTRPADNFNPLIYTAAQEAAWNALRDAGMLAAENRFNTDVVMPLVQPVQNDLAAANGELMDARTRAADLQVQLSLATQRIVEKDDEILRLKARLYAHENPTDLGNKKRKEAPPDNDI